MPHAFYWHDYIGEEVKVVSGPLRGTKGALQASQPPYGEIAYRDGLGEVARVNVALYDLRPTTLHPDTEEPPTRE